MDAAPIQCKKCGATLMKSTAKFCSRCGEKQPSAGRRKSSLVGASPTASASSTLPALVQSTLRPEEREAAAAVSKAVAAKNLIKTANGVTVLKSPSPPVVRRRSSSGPNKTFDPFAGNPPPAGHSGGASSSPTAAHKTSSSAPTSAAPRADSSTHHSADDDDDDDSTLKTPPELEAQYSVWSTLGPEGLTPEMLQTQNAAALKQWRKGTLIGRGTYGSVFLGLLPDGSFHAVKCVELGGKAAERFNVKELVSLSREINLMQRLRHRNLCHFTGVLYEPDNTSICMFMEYIGGGSLTSLVKRFKPLPPDVVRNWTTQLLSGLLYLHSQRIIHRDIKGDNVLVDTTADPSSGAQIKLVDFGAARRLTDAVSQSRTVIGTPYWMAPEVVDMSGEGKGYSYKADVWSVGCTVAEMLTGKPPWPSRSNAPAAIMMIASANSMPTEIPEEEATPGCLDFMKRCFIMNPDERPTVEELLQHPWILKEMD